MPRPYQVLTINKFSGENDVTPSAELEDAAGDLVLNLYMINGGLERRLGTLVYGDGDASDIPLGLQWCNIPKVSPTEHLIRVNSSGAFDYFSGGVPIAHGGGADETSIGTPGFTQNLDMAVVDGKLYMADGTVPMYRYDGTTFHKSGSSPPTTAPTFNAFVGAGVLTGNVQYYVTYLDADGNESEPSPASAVMAPVAQNVTINLPNDTDADRSGKNVYRLGVASTVYKLVNSSPLAAGATTYTDSVTDANLGLQIILGNTLMPSCAQLWEHDDRLFGCGNAAAPGTLYISNQFQPWYCPSSPNTEDPTQGVRLQVQGRSTKIIGGISHGGYVFIFTDEGGYILQGTTQDDYRLDRFTNHGCVSHRSIQSIRNWLFWVGPEGVYRYGGYQGTYSGISGYDALGVTRIDYPIRNFIRSMTAAQLGTACSWVYDDRYYISFGVSRTNAKCFDTRYDTEHGWSSLLWNGGIHWNCATIATTQGTNPGVPRPFVTSSYGSVSQLEVPAQYADQHPDTATADAAIAATWIGKQFNMGLPGRDKRVQMWGFKVRNPASTSGTNNVVAAIFTSGSPTASTSTAAQTRTVTLAPNVAGDDWGNAPQSGNDITEIRTEGNDALRSELFQPWISASTDTTLSDFRIVEAEMYYTMAG